MPTLQKGDRIHIVSPAKAIGSESVHFSKKHLENCGFVVTISDHCLGQHHYFSGTIEERKNDLQQAINDPDIKAILCARGGYGCVQLVDLIDWTPLLDHPKWIIGFSDVTVFHQRLFNLGLSSMHATMPLNFENNSEASLQTLVDAIQGKTYSISAPHETFNISGKASGRLIGGNLSILYSLLGTNDQVDFTGCILFIEDLAEQLYHLDRMLYALRKSGVLDQISGLIVGGMTHMKDTEIPFGQSYQEIILSHVEALQIPVAFEFPAGHLDDNRALIFGKSVHFTVEETGSRLDF